MSDSIRLLLVEDESLLHVLLEDGLGDHGFDLVIKANGKAALEELDANASHYQAVLTDIRLGEGPSGWDVARRARERVPTMPIVYMSRDSVAAWASRGVPDSVMIAKPFIVAQIVTAITGLLNTDSVHGVR